MTGFKGLGFRVWGLGFGFIEIVNGLGANKFWAKVLGSFFLEPHFESGAGCWAGLGWMAGLGWAGLGWAELGWAGLGWAGLGWAGGWAGLAWPGLAWPGWAGRAGLGWAGDWAGLGWAGLWAGLGLVQSRSKSIQQFSRARGGGRVFEDNAICHLPFAICHLSSATCHLPSAI